MFRSDDLIIRNLFAGLGLQGPSTTEQREFVRTYEPDIDPDKDYTGTVQFNGASVKTHFNGTAFAVEDVPTFTNLDEAYSLAEAMIEQLGSGGQILLRVHVFLHTAAVGYKGTRLDMNARPEVKLIPGSDEFYVTTAPTRRGNTKLVSIKLGDKANWHDFVRDFNSFHI